MGLKDYYFCLCNLPIENFLVFLLTECRKMLFKRNFKFLRESLLSSEYMVFRVCGELSFSVLLPGSTFSRTFTGAMA